MNRGLRGTSGFVFQPTSCAEVTGASYLSCGAFCALSSLRGRAREESVRREESISEAAVAAAEDESVEVEGGGAEGGGY